LLDFPELDVWIDQDVCVKEMQGKNAALSPIVCIISANIHDLRLPSQAYAGSAGASQGAHHQCTSARANAEPADSTTA
jgi:hypothetical protein